MPRLSKKAVKELRGVIAEIKAEPRRLNMHNWVMLFNPKDPGYQNIVQNGGGVYEGHEHLIAVPPCGTQGCIAGWVRLRNDPRITDLKQNSLGEGLHYETAGARTFAQEFLGLTSEQAARLFYFRSWGVSAEESYGWPKPLERAYLRAKTPRGRMLATVRRIELFIKTNGAQ